MRLFPNAKINIGLRVIRKREDGYHDLETIFYPLPGLHDVLDVEPAEVFSFSQDGIAVDCPAEDNLVLRCYRLMQQRFPGIGAVRIRLSKHIPFGAGLGGGSSDAASMAVALNSLFSLGQSTEALAALVRPLGADCPFFVYNTPCYAEGIGDQLTPVSLSLQGLRLVLCKPACGVSTREAYGGIVRHPEAADAIRTALAAGVPFADLRPLLVNDFEQTVFPLYPEIGEIKKHLLSAGAVYASMSGSGSSVFALFECDSEGRSLVDLAALQRQFPSVVLLDDSLCER